MERVGKWVADNPLAVMLPLIAVALISIAFGAYNYFEGQSLDNRVTVIERGPCSTDPQGHECQAIFRGSIRAFNPVTVCTLSRKLDLRCPPAFRR